ncbi:MAG: hypothetical protein IKU08_02925 [Clostridia bacterium]|nr:hypothetical protein [Clostridia bacterium]
MIKIFKNLHRRTKITFAVCWTAVILILSASAVLYIGAGGIFDYYAAVDLSESLLALCRPASVIAFLASLGCEYAAKQKNNT